MEYKTKNDIPKKQVHIYIYKDIERILKAYGFKPSEFITLKALELLQNTDVNTDIKELEQNLIAKEKKRENLETELNKCNNEIEDLNKQLRELKQIITNFNVSDDNNNLDLAIREVLALANNRVTSPERLPYIYFDDVKLICDRHNVNYMWVLSKIPKALLENHFKLRFKN